jgi:protein-disulfide isomerase
MISKTAISLTFFLLLLSSARSFGQSADDINNLRKQVDALGEEQKAIRKELDEIRNLLAGRQSSAPSNVDLSVEGAQFKGEQTAKVTLVEFLDYQCPFCKTYFNQTMPQLLMEYVRTGKVKYVVRDFPLQAIHPLALKAAEAARCAGEQNKFWLMHDQLMANPSSLERRNLSMNAQNLGLDVVSFEKCLDSDKYATKIDQDIADGTKAGVDGTPTFFLALTDPQVPTIKFAQRIEGLVSFPELKQAIDGLLAKEDKTREPSI